MRDTLSLPGKEGNPEWDRRIEPEHAKAFSDGLEPTLHHFLAREADKGNDGGFGQVHAIVLDQQIWINPRDPEAQELQRVNGIHTALRNARSFPLYLFTLPRLDSLEFRISRVLRNESSDISRTPEELRDQVVGLLGKIRESETVAENRESFTRDIESIGREGVVDEVVAFLCEWRLAERSPNGMVRATEKLRHVLM
ncbi:hypothetical protein ACFU8Q_40685 [Streptomyces sp. NPDC057543]|uniref:hypothetical protein n=1 Tax=Streptomyces sp. NPDC057543 TaxID=3346163 RepID=UPI0036CAF674